MIAQVADVKSTLISVRRMLEAGNRVLFEPGNCYIENITTGARTNIIEKNGAFEIGFWVPRAHGAQSNPNPNHVVSKCASGGTTNPGFARQHED